MDKIVRRGPLRFCRSGFPGIDDLAPEKRNAGPRVRLGGASASWRPTCSCPGIEVCGQTAVVRLNGPGFRDLIASRSSRQASRSEWVDPSTVSRRVHENDSGIRVRCVRGRAPGNPGPRAERRGAVGARRGNRDDDAPGTGGDGPDQAADHCDGLRLHVRVLLSRHPPALGRHDRAALRRPGHRDCAAASARTWAAGRASTRPRRPATGTSPITTAR